MRDTVSMTTRMTVVTTAGTYVMPSMRAAILALPLVLSGCGDALYYQTRASPEGGSDFSLTAWLFNHEDSEVYELPARPPAVSTEQDDAHLVRSECHPPGQKFKSPSMMSQDDGVPVASGTVERTTLYKIEDQPVAPASTMRVEPIPLAGWKDPVERGARDHTEVIPVANLDRAPKSQPASGMTTIPAVPLATSEDDNGWCPPKR